MTTDQSSTIDSEKSDGAPSLPGRAWQPITPRGVAAFSTATFGRLFLIQYLVALLAAGTLVWCLAATWFPTVREAIRQLPEKGAIRDGELNSPRTSTEPLAQRRFLAIVMDLENRNLATPPADIYVVFHRRYIELGSLLGSHFMDYPKEWSVEFNRPELEPKWGAWKSWLLLIVAAAILVGLPVTWFLLATLYCGAARLVAFFKDRELTLAGSWRLAAAALMPGALLLTVGILCYGLGTLDLIHLIVLAVLHLVVGWVYLFFCPLLLPRVAGAGPRPKNPFAAPPAGP